MNIHNFSVMEALTDRMRWLQSNQQVVSENISHSDTPGYTPNKLVEQDFSSLVAKIARVKTGGIGAGNISRPAAPNVSFGDNNEEFKKVAAVVGERRADGNGVALEDETMRLASNQMEFALVTGLYKKNHKLMRLALGKA